jgi:hypothetical protein
MQAVDKLTKGQVVAADGKTLRRFVYPGRD